MTAVRYAQSGETLLLAARGPAARALVIASARMAFCGQPGLVLFLRHTRGGRAAAIWAGVTGRKANKGKGQGQEAEKSVHGVV